MALTLWSVPFSSRDRISATGGWDSLSSFLSFAGGTAKAISGQTGVVLPKAQDVLYVKVSDYDAPYNLVQSGDRAFWIDDTEVNGSTVRLSLDYEPLLSYSTSKLGFRGLWNHLSAYWRNAVLSKTAVGGFVLPDLPTKGMHVVENTASRSITGLTAYKACVFDAPVMASLGTSRISGAINGHDATIDGVDIKGASPAYDLQTPYRPFLVVLWPDSEDNGATALKDLLGNVSTAFLGWFRVYLKTVDATKESDPLVQYELLKGADTVLFRGFVPYRQLRLLSKDADGNATLHSIRAAQEDYLRSEPLAMDDGTLFNHLGVDFSPLLKTTSMYPRDYFVLDHPDFRKPLVVDMASLTVDTPVELALDEVVNTSETLLVHWATASGSRHYPVDPYYETSFSTDAYATTKWQDYLSSNPYESTIGKALNYMSSAFGVGSAFTNSGASVAASLAKSATGVAGALSVATPLVSIGAGLAQFGIGIANNEGRLSDMSRQQGASASQMEKNVLRALNPIYPELAVYEYSAEGGRAPVLDYVADRFGPETLVRCSVGEDVETAPYGAKVSTDPAKADGDFAGYCFEQGREVQISGGVNGADYLDWQAAFADGVEMYYPGAKKFRPYDG